MGGVYNPFNLNLYAYSHQNPVKLLDPDGEAVGAAVRAFKLIKKAYKVYKKEGKLTQEHLKKAGLDELIDFAGDLYTLFDENASLLDKAEALSDITIGTEFSNKGAKEVKRIVEKVIKGGKQARKKPGDTKKPVNLIKTFLGSDVRVIKNKSGDKIFISKDGLRRVRFDLKRPNPHKNPHVHVEELINGKWQKSGPIYPKNVRKE